MRRIAVMLAVMLTFVFPVFAEVITTPATDGYADYVYVAGDSDNYPIEYYDEDKKEYSGIIPDLLKEISSRSGINFVYINGNKQDKNVLGENLQVDIVSSMGKNAAYGSEYLELISYNRDGKTVTSGVVFTKLAPADVIASVKSASGEISSDERNGIYLSYATQSSKTDYKWIFIAGIMLLLLLALITALIIRIRRIKKEHESDKVTDSETGMGNLQFFKYHFKFTIDDISRNLYHVAYIILSSFLTSFPLYALLIAHAVEYLVPSLIVFVAARIVRSRFAKKD